MTTGSSKSNHHSLHPRDDREALSALFDGALPADAARFALKRLDHDAEWREACGRWQLIGDTLRGERAVVAPAHFAAGVMRALAAERQAGDVTADAATQTMTVATHAHPRRRWLGGAALAASVAVAAVLVVRPFSQPSTAMPEGQVATEVASPAPVSGGPTAPAATATATTPASAVATTDATPVGTTARPGRVPHPVARASRSPMTPSRTPVGEPTTVVASASATNANHQPFHPPEDDIVTRPWPRSVLSDGAAAGALTVDFSPGSVAPSSLYPFEPRLQETQPVKSQPADPQR